MFVVLVNLYSYYVFAETAAKNTRARSIAHNNKYRRPAIV